MKNKFKLNDTNLYRSTLLKRLVSESDTDPLNSTVNPLVNPNQVVPSDWTKPNPNVSVSGFIDELPYTELGTCLQSQLEGPFIWIARVIERFEGLKVEITDWENFIKCRVVEFYFIKCWVVSTS